MYLLPFLVDLTMYLGSDRKRKRADAESKPDDLDDLKTLIAQIPPSTLRNFVLSRLDSPSQELVDSLRLVFTGLRIPETLHCLRCHTDYVEDDNTNTSCQMPHDDEERDDDNYDIVRWPCCGEEEDLVSVARICKRNGTDGV